MEGEERSCRMYYEERDTIEHMRNECSEMRERGRKRSEEKYRMKTMWHNIHFLNKPINDNNLKDLERVASRTIFLAHFCQSAYQEIG
jgi:predicted nuclease with TOPRIM domain